MGCLEVTIKPVPLHNVAVETENLNELDVVLSNKNDISVDVANKNTMPTVTAVNKNVDINVVIALVCQVSLSGKYEYFYVTEGPFVVENGYFMVSRK